MSQRYPRGTQIKVSARFLNAAGALVDPDTTTASLKSPAGATTNPSVTNEGTGLRSFTFTASTGGRWFWRIEGTGAAQGADEGYVDADPGAF
jgi:nitrogen fixation protein FixH